jgi:hypothetical protein
VIIFRWPICVVLEDGATSGRHPFVSFGVCVTILLHSSVLECACFDC